MPRIRERPASEVDGAIEVAGQHDVAGSRRRYLATGALGRVGSAKKREVSIRTEAPERSPGQRRQAPHTHRADVNARNHCGHRVQPVTTQISGGGLRVRGQIPECQAQVHRVHALSPAAQGLGRVTGGASRAGRPGGHRAQVCLRGAGGRGHVDGLPNRALAGGGRPVRKGHTPRHGL
jgi:hypothetical protein